MMRLIQKKTARLLICLLMGTVILSCGQTESGNTADGGTVSEHKIHVVTSNFVLYDFARQVGGEDISVEMLLKPGVDSHSYEPAPADMIALSEADVLLYIGGESEGWIQTMLDAADTNQGQKRLALMDCVTLLEEETDGDDLSESDGSSEAEYDEHIWTSPVNAIDMVAAIRDVLTEADSKHGEDYAEGAAEYIAKLQELDAEIREIVANADKKELIFADRFPFLYFAKEYGLTYYAAFPGCSASTEASAKTVRELIERVREDDVTAVCHIELSNTQLSDTIARETGTVSVQLTACHNISEEDYLAGRTYLDYMEENAAVLREVLYGADSM